MLILAFAPAWFGLLGLYSEIDYSSDFLLQHMLQNPNYLHNEITKMSWGLIFWLLLLYFFIFKTYEKSALVVKKPVKYKIGLVRNIVFIVIGIIGSIHFVKGFFAGIKLIHAWNELMADNIVKSLYGLAETAIPALKEMKWFYGELILWNALSFLCFVFGIILTEVLGVLQCFIVFYAPKEVANELGDGDFPYAEMKKLRDYFRRKQHNDN